MFWSSSHEACGIPAPQPGIEPAPPALDGEVLPTGPAGKSHGKSSFAETRKKSPPLPALRLFLPVSITVTTLFPTSPHIHFWEGLAQP